MYMIRAEMHDVYYNAGVYSNRHTALWMCLIKNIIMRHMPMRSSGFVVFEVVKERS